MSKIAFALWANQDIYVIVDQSTLDSTADGYVETSQYSFLEIGDIQHLEKEYIRYLRPEF